MPAASSKSDGTGVNVKKSQLTKAIVALKELVTKQSANANPLFGASSETMSVVFTLSRIPDKRKIKPVLIPLPHPLHDDKSEICFFSKDPQKEFKELLLDKHKVPGITKVIGLQKLRKNYKTESDKRALADSFDLFLCDKRIIEFMPAALGTIFYKKKLKPPIPVLLKKDDPAPALTKAISSTTLRIPQGPCLGVRFGRCSMEPDELVKNAAVVIAHVVKHMQHIPVSTINVQATSSPALPVWRRERVGELVDFKKLNKAAASSAASDTEKSGMSDSESKTGGGDTISELDTAGESLSELETGDESLSALDSEAGDVDEIPMGRSGAKTLAKSLKRKRQSSAGSETRSPKQSPKSSPKASPKAAVAKSKPKGHSSPKTSPKSSPKTSPKVSPKVAPKGAMGPPAKKAKKGKKA